MKKTAVEWLVEQLKERGFIFTYAGEFPPHLLFDQAKAMEKEQIIEAANILLYHGPGPGNTAAEQYYNETFKSE